jgi:tetratricopeptide (TPR) repeat protein
LNNLGAALKDRYDQRGDLDDLEDMVRFTRESVKVLQPGELLRGENAFNLADALRMRFQRLGNLPDLNEAIQLLQSISRPVDHSNYAQERIVLGGSLLSRFHKLQKVEDLDEAISVLQQASECCERKDMVGIAFHWLAQAQATRAQYSSSMKDTEAARKSFDQAFDKLPIGHSDRVECVLARADFELQQDSFSTRSLALGLALDVLNDNNAHPQHRLDRVLHLFHRFRDVKLDDLRSSPELASRVLDIYSAAVRLLPEVAYFGMSIESRLRALSNVGDVIPDVVAYAGACNRIDKAVEILAGSRTVFWQQALRLRTPFDSLPDDLREELSTLSRQLEQESFVSRSECSSLGSRLSDEHEVIRRRRDSEKFRRLICKAQSLPGIEPFMQQDEFSRLSMAASRGPVVLLVCSAFSCDAIILRSPGSVMRVVLSSVSEDWLTESSISWRNKTSRARGELRNRLHMKKLSKVHANRDKECLAQEEYSLLQELWVRIAHPVIQQLGLQVRL